MNAAAGRRPYRDGRAAGELAFGRFRLQPERRLFADGESVAIGAKPLVILSVLVAAGGDIVSKEDLIGQAWPGMAVEDNTLQAQVSALRKALGVDGSWVVTVPGRGYRFAGPRPIAGGREADPRPSALPPAEPAPRRHRRFASLAPKILAGAILAGMAAAGLFAWRWNQAPATGTVRIERYLVMPFANRTGDPRNQDFAETLSDAVAGRLAAETWDSEVIGRNKVAADPGQPVNEAKLVEDFGLSYIVEGSLLPSGGGMDASLTIVDARTGSQIATVSGQASTDGLDTDRLSLVTGLVDHVRSSIFRYEKHLIDAGRKDDGDIRNLLIRAETSWGDPTADGWDASMALIDKALRLDPHNVHALSLAGAARLQYVTGLFYRNEAERALMLDRAEAELTEAVRIDPKRTIVHLKLGDLHAAQGRHDAARAEFQRAFDLDPSSAYALDRLAMEDIHAGRPEDALPKLDRARRLNPDDSYRIAEDTALMRLNLGQDDAALAAIRQAIAIKPDEPQAWVYLTGLLRLTGRADEARTALATLRRLAPGVNIARLQLADANTSPRYLRSQDRLYAALREAGLEDGPR